MTQMQHKCDKNATRMARVRHECYTNETGAIRAKKVDFDNDTSKNIFLHPYLTIWQMKDYKERNNFILKANIWKCLVCQNTFEKCTTKTELFNGTSYIKKL